MKFIGIDIAKDIFVAAYPQLNGYKTQTYNNDLKGGKKFIGSITKIGHHCVLEATGNYGTLLLYLLSNHNVAVSLVNPKQIKHFARMMMAGHQGRSCGCQINSAIWRKDDSRYFQNAFRCNYHDEAKKSRFKAV